MKFDSFRTTLCTPVLVALAAQLSACGAPVTLSRVARGDQVQTTFGDVSPEELLVVRPGVGTLTPPPRHLQKGDEVSTGPSTRILLRFADSVYVLVEPNTSLTISSVRLRGPRGVPGAPEVEGKEPSGPRAVGKILVKMRAWRGRFRAETEFFQAEVKSTKYTLSLDARGHSVLQTFEGTVEVSSRAAAWPTVDVDEGEAVSIDGGGPPEKRPLTSEDLAVLDAAFRAFDRLLDLGY